MASRRNCFHGGGYIASLVVVMVVVIVPVMVPGLWKWSLTCTSFLSGGVLDV